MCFPGAWAKLDNTLALESVKGVVAASLRPLRCVRVLLSLGLVLQLLFLVLLLLLIVFLQLLLLVLLCLLLLLLKCMPLFAVHVTCTCMFSVLARRPSTAGLEHYTCTKYSRCQCLSNTDFIDLSCLLV